MRQLAAFESCAFFPPTLTNRDQRWMGGRLRHREEPSLGQVSGLQMIEMAAIGAAPSTYRGTFISVAGVTQSAPALRYFNTPTEVARMPSTAGVAPAGCSRPSTTARSAARSCAISRLADDVHAEAWADAATIGNLAVNLRLTACATLRMVGSSSGARCIAFVM